MVNITENEKDVIKNGFGNNEFNNEGEPVWSYSIQPNCKIVSKKQINGVISSLVKKGLVVTQEYEDNQKVAGLTIIGKELLKSYRPKIVEVIPETAITITPISFEVSTPVKSGTIIENIRLIATELDRPFKPKEMVEEFMKRGFTGKTKSIIWTLQVLRTDINASPTYAQNYKSVQKQAFLKFENKMFSI